MIPLRKTENYYVAAKKGSVAVAFALEFAEESEQAVARVFAQEFVEAQRGVNNAPSVMFSKEPPLPLAGVSLPEPSEQFVGYVTFSESARRAQGPELPN